MEIKACIPDTIVVIGVKPGGTAKTRDNLGIVEVMKVKQPAPYPKGGVVKGVLVSVGDKAESDAVLLPTE